MATRLDYVLFDPRGSRQLRHESTAVRELPAGPGKAYPLLSDHAAVESKFAFELE